MDGTVNECRRLDRAEAIKYLNALIGKPVKYIIKSPDMNLYDFGFGDTFAVEGALGLHRMCEYTMHTSSSAIRVFWDNEEESEYSGNTSSKEVSLLSERLMNSIVKSVALNDKNDLCIDFEICRMVVVTFEDAEESWRVFHVDVDRPHLVAADSWICL